MSRPPTSKSKRDINRREEYRKEVLAEKLSEFEEFQALVLPQLRKLVTEGASSKRMREELSPLLQARLLSIALTSLDEGKSMSAIIDTLNRVEGKPVEKTESVHRFAKLKDEELDAMLEARLKEAEPTGE
jgi:hypothetical protein